MLKPHTDSTSPIAMYAAFHSGRHWWASWQEQSINRRIFSAMLTVGFLTIIAKCASASKDFLIAYQFGASDALDAFIMALLVPTFAINLISGSLNAALIPTYIQVFNQDGAEAAQRLFSSTMVCTMLLLLIVTIGLFFVGPYLLPLVALGFSTEKLKLTASLYNILLPCLLITGVATTWNALLNARERFAAAGSTPIVAAVFTALLLVLFADMWGIYALAIGTILGFMLEVGVLGWCLRSQGVPLLPRWHGATPSLKQVQRQYAPVLAGAFMMGSTDIVGQSMAAMLGPGSNAVLSYGSKLPLLLLGIGSLAVSTTVLPYFSRMAADGDHVNIRHTLTTYARLILVVTIPLTLLLAYYSEPLVRLLFQRGAFSEADTQKVAWVQTLYLLQVPTFSLGILAVRLISSLQANRVLMWSSALNLFVTVSMTYGLMQWLAVAGIALATSVMYLLSMLFLMYMAGQLIKELEHRQDRSGCSDGSRGPCVSPS